MIKRVPLQSPEATSRFFSKIIGMSTLKARLCGGIPAKVMVLKNSVLVAIAWSSLISTKSVNKNTCSRLAFGNLNVERVHDCIFCCQNNSIVHVSLVCVIDC
jgi:hypothetical protein